MKAQCHCTLTCLSAPQAFALIVCLATVSQRYPDIKQFVKGTAGKPELAEITNYPAIELKCAPPGVAAFVAVERLPHAVHGPSDCSRQLLSANPPRFTLIANFCRYIGGHNPDLVMLNEAGEEVDRIDLTKIVSDAKKVCTPRLSIH